jgi:3-hydroxyacyl-[acyl-carrier-protein] dehydratase
VLFRIQLLAGDSKRGPCPPLNTNMCIPMDVTTHISLPQEGSYFEGHFPGQPILPGVAQLALVQEALAKAGVSLPLREITFTRLRQIVLPGDTLELTTRKSEDDRLRFDLKRDNKLVTNGELLFGPLTSSDESAHSVVEKDNSINGIPPMEALLPHRQPMLFVQSVLNEMADSIACEVSIPSACALVCEGSAFAVAGIEAAAQAAAAWEALQRSRDGGVAGARVGYLVAIRDVTFFIERIPVDVPLQVSVELEAAALPLSHYRMELFQDGKPLVRGSFATFLAQNEP